MRAGLNWFDPGRHLAGVVPGLLQTLDPDKDGTVDLAEAKDAASKLFDKLDRDHDDTLDKRECVVGSTAAISLRLIPTMTVH
jgi:hypothetical protein